MLAQDDFPYLQSFAKATPLITAIRQHQMCFLGHIYKMPEGKHVRDTLSLFQPMAEDDQASRGQVT